jgi:hypothetical protein
VEDERSWGQHYRASPACDPDKEKTEPHRNKGLTKGGDVEPVGLNQAATPPLPQAVQPQPPQPQAAQASHPQGMTQEMPSLRLLQAGQTVRAPSGSHSNLELNFFFLEFWLTMGNLERGGRCGFV